MELLYIPMQDKSIPSKIEHISRIIRLLDKANEHALAAARSGNICSKERAFIHFMDLVMGGVRSIHFMMRHQNDLEEKESFLCTFLGVPLEQCHLPALHYQRRAEDLFHGLWELLRLASKPYRDLHNEMEKKMSADEKKRFDHAYNSLRKELNSENSVKVDSKGINQGGES